MDFINKIANEAGQQLGQNQGGQGQQGGMDQNNPRQQTGANPPPAANNQEEKVASGFMGSFGGLGGIGDKLNAAAGGGKESEKNEDLLDKGTLREGLLREAFCSTAFFYFIAWFIMVDGDVERDLSTEKLT